MWLRTSDHKLLSVNSARLESIQLRPIMHSDSFGLFVKGREELVVNLGNDLDKATQTLDKVCIALANELPLLDLREDL